MNKTYRLVWNVSLGVLQAVSELARARTGKQSGAKRMARRAGGRSGANAVGGSVATSASGGRVNVSFVALSASRLLLLSTLSSSAIGANLVWSPTGPNSGGSGTWDTSLTNSAWYNGTVSLPWNNATGDSAAFGGTAGTVTVSGTVNVQNIGFQTTGYVLTGGTINFGTTPSIITTDVGVTATIGSVLQGTTASVTKSGAGTLILTGTNTYGGGTIIKQGTLQVSADANLGAAAGSVTFDGGTLATTATFSTARSVKLNAGGGTIDVAPLTALTMSGVISNGNASGALNKTNTGTLILTGTNTYTGVTTIAGGTLQTGNGGTTGTLGTGAVTNNGTLAFNRSNAYSFSGAISGSGTVIQNGPGTLTLGGANSYIGGTTINAGTVQISADANLGAATGALTFNGGALQATTNVSTSRAIALNNSASFSSTSGTLTLAGVVSGNGGVTVTGGTVFLNNASNTYTGGTTVNAATLSIAGDGSLGAALGGVTLSNGAYLTTTSTFSTGRTFTLSSGLGGFNTSSSTTLTVNGNIAGTGSLQKGGLGTLVLKGNNAYTGGTFINGGSVQVSIDANLGSALGGVQLSGGSNLLTTGSFATARGFVLNSGTVGLNVLTGTTLTLNGIVSGAGQWILSGAGTTVLGGANTYTGGTRIDRGVVQISADNNLGATSGTLRFNGGTLAVTSTFNSTRAVTLNDGNGGGIIDVANGQTLTLNGVISNGNSAGGFTKTNTGTLVLGGTNTYSGVTTISAGTLQVGNGGTSGILGAGNTTNNAALVFNRSDTYSYGGAISGTGSLTQTGTGTTVLTGTNSYAGPTTVSAGALYVDGNSSGAHGLISVASGATLGGKGTIGGNVTIASGATFAPGSVAGPGTQTINGNLALSGGSILRYRLGQADTVGGSFNDLTQVNGNLTLAGTLNVSQAAGGVFGPGTYRLFNYTGTLTNNGLSLGTMPAGTTNTLQTSVANQVNLVTSANVPMSFWDAANPNNGAVNGGTGVWQSSAGNQNWTDANGTANGPYGDSTFAVFQGTPGTVTVDNSLGQVTSSGMQFGVNGYTVTGNPISLVETTSGSNASTIRVGDGTAAGAGYSATIGSVLQGSTRVIKADLGTLALAGANTYTGGTTVSGGTLQLGNGGTSGSIVGDVLDNGTLAFNRSDSSTFSGVISGSGTVNQRGAGTTILTGANTYTGLTTISSGTLQIGNGGTTGTLGAGNVVDNGTLTFNLGNSYAYNGVISGSGQVRQAGAGTTVLGATNTYTGGTAITAGTLQVAADANLGAASGALSIDGGTLATTANITSVRATTLGAGGGTFDVANGTTLTMNGVVSGSGPLIKNNSGTLTLNGTNIYAGGTVVNGGTVLVNSDAGLGASSGGVTLSNGARLLATTSLASARNIVISGSGGLGSTAGTLTANGVISGGTLNLTGNLVLTGNNSFSALNMTNGGSVSVSSDANLGAAGSWISLGNFAVLGVTSSFTSTHGLNWIAGIGGGTLYVADGQTLTQAGTMAGSAALRKTGNGAVVLTANTGYGGGLSISAGRWQFGNGGTSGSMGGSIGISGTGTVAFNRSDTSTYAGPISGTVGSLEQIGSGTTILTGANTFIGTTTIEDGTLQIGSGTSGSFAGNITNNSRLAFGRSDTITYAGSISGSGSVTQAGIGTTVLTGTNTYTGGTNFNAGTLQVAADTNLGDASGALAFNGGSLRATASFSTSRAATLAAGGGTFNIDNGTTLTETGLISGTGGLTKVGTGTLVLTGANTFTGPTTVSNGSLYVDGKVSATLVASGATLGGAGTIGGNVTVANGGSLAPGHADGTSGTLTINGDLTLNSTSNLNFTFGQINNVAASDLINVNGNVTAAGLLNVTTPAGGTFAPGIYRVLNYTGTLANNGLALGSVPVGTTLTLQMGVAHQINLVNTTGQPLAFWDGSSPTSKNDGNLDGGSGIWNTSTLGADNWSGGDGSANAPYTNGFFAVFQGTPGTVTVDNTFGQVSTSGVQFVVDGYTINGQPLTLTETSSGTGNTTLRVGDGTETFGSMTGTIAAVLQGTTGVTKTGLGTLVLSGANTYSGGTTISAGKLQISADANLGGPSGGLTFDSGTLATTASFNSARAVTVTANGGTIDVAAGTTLGLTGVIGGAGALTKTDTGTLVLSGTNTYSGGTNINAGTLQLGDGGATGSITGDVTNNGTLAFNRNNTMTVAGVISGNGTVNQIGSGTTVLTGANTYSGGTNINAGTLQLGDGGATGSITGDVTNNGTLAFNRNNTMTVAGVISGTGVVNQIGSGTTVLSGTNTYSGGTNITAGTLVAQSGSALGTGAVVNNAALQLDFVGNATLANTLSGTGSVSKTGAGTAALTAAGSSAGAVTVNAGTLQFGQTGGFGATTLTTASGANTAIGANGWVTLSGALTQSAGSTLSTAVGSLTQPAVTAATASLNGTLNLTGYNVAAPTSASALVGSQFTVVHTTGGITGDFASVLLNGASSPVDYLRVAGRISGNDYNVGYGLTWLDGPANGNGSFTLVNASDAFNVDVALGNQAGPFTSGWDGKTLTKAGAGVLTLSAVNTYSGDTVINGGTLRAGIANAFAQSANVKVAAAGTLDLNGFNQTANNLSGAGSVTLGNATLTANANVDTTYSGVISGSGVLTKTGAATLTLSGTNTYSGGTNITAGTLQLGDGGATGSIVGDVTNNGTLTFNRNNAITIAGAISGTGAVNQIGSGTTVLTGENTYSGGTTISAGTLQLGNGGTTGSVQGAIDVANGATLALERGAAYTLNNTLSGTGLMTVNAAGQSFDFATAATGSGFGGTVALQNTTFNLGGANAGALAGSTLRLDSGSVTTVADGTQSIQGLAFNGGKAIFNASAPAQTQATSLIQAGTLDVSSTGTVQVTVPTPYVVPTTTPSSGLSVLQQDDVNVGTRLVSAGTVRGSGGALTLVDQNGQTISAAQSVNVQQGGNLVAVGTYDYGLSTGASQNGLYVSYGLKQLDLQAGQSLSLTEGAGATGNDADLSAKLTGTGNLVIAANNKVSLSNTTNDFSGTTTVKSGTLEANAVNVIAHSSAVTVDAGTTLDTNGFNQSLSNLTGAGTVTNGTSTATTLTLNDSVSSTFSGSITGAQLALVQASGTQVLSGTNNYGGGTTINSGATLQLGDGGATGSITGDVTDNGTLVFNRNNTMTVAGVISGTGAVNQNGSGTTVLSGTNTYSGGTNINAGTVAIGNAEALGTGTVAMAEFTALDILGSYTVKNNITLSGDPIVNVGDGLTATLTGSITDGTAPGVLEKTGVGTLVLGSTSNTYSGATNVLAGTLQAGAANSLSPNSAFSVAAGATLALNGLSQTVAGLTNAGTVNFGTGTTPGAVLTVAGNYVGNGGQIVLNTVLGDDSSATDKLVINGGQASGNTALVIKHAGGNGAQTNQGIRLVETQNGGTTEQNAFSLSSSSDGYRQGVGTIASGAYDYSLKRGGNAGVANDWYLVSAGNQCSTNAERCPPTPPADQQLRPEVGSYLNNRLAASTQQIHTLHERQSQAPGMQGPNLNDVTDPNAWVRVVGKTSNRTGAGGMDLSDTSYLVHAGGDVARFNLGDSGSLRVGAMGAYGSSNNRADNGKLGARGSVEGYSAGVYGTWYGNQDVLSGPYVDSWVMYGKFNNTVSGQGLPTERYKSSNLAASLEGGYSFPILESENTRMFIEPQAQIIVSNYRANDHTEHNGTVVSGQSGTSVTTRVGVRLHGSIADDHGMKQMRPFAEVNWWHGPNSQSISFDGIAVNDALPANRIEAKVGLQGNVSKSVSVWGSVGVETGAHNYTAGKAQVGMKYSW
ncbi:autotransporter-associated beta strand repeat-containing protein [Cupriavidus sp. H39]|uniref:autotransporter-associated beta strand repeat-containing protein n=1 Tax=Cupriavidus sp. H39 TaxID=3401635 RepID=UPI003CFEADC2